MKSRFRVLALFAVAMSAAIPCGYAAAQETLTYPDLVKRLVDLQNLAVLPAEGETCSQWSSWDRASKYDEATGKYVRWDANGDGGGIIRQEGEPVGVGRDGRPRLHLADLVRQGERRAG